MKITGRQTEPIKCYKKDQLTEDFFAGQICSRKGMETEKYWSDAFKSCLRDILDEVHSSDYGDIRDDIDSDWNMDYEDSSLTIRISDHDFGGNRDYSYQFPCVNVIVEV